MRRWSRYPGGALKDPAFEKWMKEVAALPAEKQVEAVVKRLRELNPGFAESPWYNIEDGVVTELRFAADNVTDISPVRALRRIAAFSVVAAAARARVSSPTCRRWRDALRTWLAVVAVSDLSPLKGMPLTTACAHAGIRPVAAGGDAFDGIVLRPHAGLRPDAREGDALDVGLVHAEEDHRGAGRNSPDEKPQDHRT